MFTINPSNNTNNAEFFNNFNNFKNFYNLINNNDKTLKRIRSGDYGFDFDAGCAAMLAEALITNYLDKHRYYRRQNM